jgi:hypothetical protein
MVLEDVGALSCHFLVIEETRSTNRTSSPSDREGGSLDSAAGHPFARRGRAWWVPATTDGLKHFPGLAQRGAMPIDELASGRVRACSRCLGLQRADLSVS